MKNPIYLIFILFFSHQTYSQIASLDSYPISNVYVINMNSTIDNHNPLIVPPGKLWYINSWRPSSINTLRINLNNLNGETTRGDQGDLFPEGTKIYSNDTGALNIIEYDFEYQNLANNDIKIHDQIKLFPNPTNSRISFNSEKDYKIEVFDMSGRKIMESSGNSLDMTNLSKATYIVKALDKVSKETHSYTVIKN